MHEWKTRQLLAVAAAVASAAVAKVNEIFELLYCLRLAMRMRRTMLTARNASGEKENLQFSTLPDRR